VTEQEWLACDDLDAMVGYVASKGGVRRARLFAVACCRRAWGHHTDSLSHDAFGVMERQADGLAESAEWERVRAAALGPDALVPTSTGSFTVRERNHPCWVLSRAASAPPGDAMLHAAWRAAVDAGYRAPTSAGGSRGQRAAFLAAQAEESASQRALLRDIFGNPFRPLLLEPSWRTPAVLSLSQAAYDERIMPQGHLDPVRLAVLADALEELGAAGEAVGHLRSAGPHVRGCFVVDAVLGRD
jgi:hypothetical protein